MASGDVLLDADGNSYLDADGNVRIVGADANDCECCECGPCDRADMPSSVLVSGTFTGCETCITDVGEPEWDNILHLSSVPADGCLFVMNEVTYVGGATIGGSVSTFVDVGLSWSEIQCKWRLLILCRNLDTGTNDLWVGGKSGDPTDPLGTYTRTAGCDLTATRTVT